MSFEKYYENMDSDDIEDYIDEENEFIEEDELEEDDDDYEFARKKMRQLVSQGSVAFENMIEVAKESEHPRAYEVLSGMMKNISDISSSLVDMKKKKKETDFIGKNPRKEALPGNTTNNIIFAGSTEQLQKALLQQREEVIEVTPEGKE